jgi:hypothetical protein
MSRNETRLPIEVEYEKVLKILSLTEKYLLGLNTDSATLTSFRKLLRYLRSRPATSIPEIIGGVSSKKGSVPQKVGLSDEAIRSMSVETILDLASDKGVPRRQIERIASVRFGMTRGGLSTLRSRDALVEKLRTLIGNEVTHESITRAATQQLSSR